MRIYLDNCCYNRPFDEHSIPNNREEADAVISILEDFLAGKHTLVWSFILEREAYYNSSALKLLNAIRWRNLADVYCFPSDEIKAMAIEIMKHGIKTNDALHIACAITKNCDCFITTDKKLLNKKVSGIKIINPTDFINETEAL